METYHYTVGLEVQSVERRGTRALVKAKRGTNSTSGEFVGVSEDYLELHFAVPFADARLFPVGAGVCVTVLSEVQEMGITRMEVRVGPEGDV